MRSRGIGMESPPAGGSEAATGASISLHLQRRRRRASRNAASPAGAENERVMAQVWRDSDFVRVERTAPRASSAGKILHVRSAAARGGPPDAED